MAGTTRSLNVAKSEDLMAGGGNMSKTSPSKTEHVLVLENIQIQIPEDVGTQTTVKEVLEKRNNTQAVKWIMSPIEEMKKGFRCDVELELSRRMTQHKPSE